MTQLSTCSTPTETHWIRWNWSHTMMLSSLLYFWPRGLKVWIILLLRLFLGGTKLFRVSMGRLSISSMLPIGTATVWRITNLYRVRLEGWEAVFFLVVGSCPVWVISREVGLNRIWRISWLNVINCTILSRDWQESMSIFWFRRILLTAFLIKR